MRAQKSFFSPISSVCWVFGRLPLSSSQQAALYVSLQALCHRETASGKDCTALYECTVAGLSRTDRKIQGCCKHSGTLILKMMASEEKNLKPLCNGKAPVLGFNNRILTFFFFKEKNNKLIIQTQFFISEWAKLTIILLHSWISTGQLISFQEIWLIFLHNC